MHIPPEATQGAYGALRTEARTYRPLDEVRVGIEGRAQGDSRCTIRVCDPEQEPYFEAEVPLRDNRGQISFKAAGRLGVHYIYLTWPSEKHHSRYLNFRLDCETGVESGDPDFDGLYPFVRENTLLGRREYATPRGRLVGYISADTWNFDGIWLRDWIYGLPAYKYWERDLACGLDRFLEMQAENGMIPDGIQRDGRTWRVGMESDVEYIMTLAVWQTWQVTGDDAWLEQVLPKLEKALAYIRSDPKHWDPVHRLIKRQHSCDTWDFDIEGVKNDGTQRHVIATCDQSGYYLAFLAMSRMYRQLRREERASFWEKEAEAYRRRAAELLWDGEKFRHHVHLVPIDHGDFDEDGQLAMGNVWALTRGLATREQAIRIIELYRRRHAQTGDAYPWWSLQPGYPDRLGYFKQPFTRQGGYANGGLMPFVGGELCRAALENGRELYGVELLRQFAGHLRRTGGAQVWYWPNGEPGFRTTNEVAYAGWGTAEWVGALIEGLAGIHDASGQMRRITLAPRWAATPVRSVRAAARYAATGAYFAYRLNINADASEVNFEFCGSGQQADFRILMPEGRRPAQVEINSRAAPFTVEQVDRSLYAVFTAGIHGAGAVKIDCRAVA